MKKLVPAIPDRHTLGNGYFKYAVLAAIIVSFSLQGCVQTPEKASAADPVKKELSTTGNFSRQTDIVFDSTQISVFFERFPGIKMYEQDVREFYRGGENY